MSVESKIVNAISDIDSRVGGGNPFKDKWVSILGDSISTYKGFNPDGLEYTEQPDLTSVDKTWWGHLLTKLGAKLCVNYSKNGQTLCGGTGAVNSDFHKNLHREAGKTYRNLDGTTSTETKRIEPDIILIALGVNDYGKALCPAANLTTNEIDEETSVAKTIKIWPIDMNIQLPIDYKDVACFDNAYRTCLKDLMYDYPYATVYCIAPLYTNKGDGSKYPVTANGQDGSWTPAELHEHIRKISLIYNDKFIDLGRLGVQPKDAYNGTDKFYYSGGAHPTAMGHKMIGEYVYRNMINDCVSWNTRNDI